MQWTGQSSTQLWSTQSRQRRVITQAKDCPPRGRPPGRAVPRARGAASSPWLRSRGPPPGKGRAADRSLGGYESPPGPKRPAREARRKELERWVPDSGGRINTDFSVFLLP